LPNKSILQQEALKKDKIITGLSSANSSNSSSRSSEFFLPSSIIAPEIEIAFTEDLSVTNGKSKEKMKISAKTEEKWIAMKSLTGSIPGKPLKVWEKPGKKALFFQGTARTAGIPLGTPPKASGQAAKGKRP
jgi:hypothetical protein